MARDHKSTNSKNLLYVKKLSGLDPREFSSQKIKLNLPVREVPDDQKWRLGLMSSLLAMKEDKFVVAQGTPDRLLCDHLPG